MHKDFFEQVIDIIRQYSEIVHGGNKKRTAEALGVGVDLFSKWLKGERRPTLALIAPVLDRLGVRLHCPDIPGVDIQEISFVPMVKARPRAGTGGLETDGEYEAFYSFHKAFLERKGAATAMRLFRVDGDSMTPTLWHGDSILVDTSEAARQVVSTRIYLLRLEDELMVKRLATRPGGIAVCSDNARYPEIFIEHQAVGDTVEIHGRVVWSCHEY